VLHTITEWLKNHPVLYPFILFVFAAFVSIYSQEIKRFLHHWPKTAEHSRKSAQQFVTRQLALINALHNDSYHLLIYFADRFILLVIEGFVLMLIVFVIGLVIKIHPKQSLIIWGSLMAGSLIGAVLEVRRVLKQLLNYDQSVTDLQAYLTKLNRQAEE
jgi:hypothetical protein